MAVSVVTHENTDLSQRFRRFALAHALPSSPLYSALALGMADDEALLRLAAQAHSRPVTNLFFAAVHALLLGGADHAVRDFYPNLTRSPQPADRAFPAFRDFCFRHDEFIEDVLRTRRVQTNEVRRCLYLALGFDAVAREAGAYSVVDVGASAGLHLLWPHFAYDYEGRALGDPSSSVRLTCRFEGSCRPWLPNAWQEPVEQIGIDLHPLDPSCPENALWLCALVWPEHAERADLLAHALDIARDRRPSVLPGSVFDRLPPLVEQSPRDRVWCVCHNHTLNQFSEADRARFDAMLDELASGRTIYRLSAEWIGTECPEFVLSRYRDGQRSQRLLAHVDDHGGWVRWGPPGEERFEQVRPRSRLS